MPKHKTEKAKANIPKDRFVRPRTYNVYARFATAGPFKDLLKVIRDIVPNANIHFTEAGISMQALDSAHVSLVSVRIDSSTLMEYSCLQPQTIGISMQALHSHLTYIHNTDNFVLETASADANVLGIRHGIAGEYNSARMMLLDIDEEQLGIPCSDPDVVVLFPSNRFKKKITAYKNNADVVQIEIRNGKMKLTAGSKHEMGVKTVFTNGNIGDDDEPTIIETRPFKDQYSLGYLAKFATAALLGDQVELRFVQDNPIQLNFPIDGLCSTSRSAAMLTFHLAPKLANDD